MKVVTDLWDIQKEAVEFAKDKKQAALFMYMGTGKTLSVLKLMEAWQTKKVLIICPLTVGRIWEEQIEQHTEDYGEILTLLSGTSTKRAKDLAKSKANIIIINYESVWRDLIFSQLVKIKFDLIVCDESHRIKSHKSKASKRIARLNSKRKLILTGTPYPNTRLDVFGQFRFLNSSIFGKVFYRFRNTYAKMKLHPFPIIEGWQREKEFFEKVAKYAFIAGRDQAKGLPDEVLVTRQCELDKAIVKNYKELEEDLVTEFEKAGKVISPIVIVSYLRLHQIVGGFANDIKVAESKLKLLGDVLSDLDEPIVIFCRFTNEVKEIKSLTGGKELSGSVNELDEWLSGEHNILVSQIQKGAEGIDLSRARVIIYYSVDFNNATFLQSNARIVRPNSEHESVLIIRLIVENTIDEYIYKNLDNKNEGIKYIVQQIKENRK